MCGEDRRKLCRIAATAPRHRGERGCFREIFLGCRRDARVQRLSVAAVKGDAKGVRAAANSLKRKVMGNAASAAAVGARA